MSLFQAAHIDHEMGGRGMLTVETIGRIRREFFVKGKTIKEIARDLRLSRNTVRKVVRSQATSFEYERSVQPLPRLGAWTATLDGMLMENALKPTRERLTVIRIFEALRDLGYEGGYDAVRRYAKRWRSRQVSGTVDAHVPLIFAPGEAYQFDWSHEIVVLNGTTTMVKAAHLRLCHSRMMFVRAYPRESQKMVFDVHDRGFAFFRGACTRGIPEYVPGHIFRVTCRSSICGRTSFCRETWPGGVGTRPHNSQSVASHSSRVLSFRHTGLRGNPAEAPIGGVQAFRAASFMRMLISA